MGAAAHRTSSGDVPLVTTRVPLGRVGGVQGAARTPAGAGRPAAGRTRPPLAAAEAAKPRGPAGLLLLLPSGSRVWPSSDKAMAVLGAENTLSFCRSARSTGALGNADSKVTLFCHVPDGPGAASPAPDWSSQGAPGMPAPL